jgi:heme-degrading monooxygenase HmoA
MFIVIFEVEPKPDRAGEYLKLAQDLKPKVEAIDGFLGVERFASRRRQRRLLSLSTWRDEDALLRWRMQGDHRRAQGYGRSRVFQDYRLRVGEIVDQNSADLRAPGNDGAVTITEAMLDPAAIESAAASSEQMFDPATDGLIDQESFASLYTAGKLVHVASWREAAAARASQPRRHAGLVRHLEVRLIRDYGMFERTEAPQSDPAREAARA